MDVDRTAWIREQAAERERLINALNEVESTKGWQYLKDNVFTGAIETLEKKLIQEAKKLDPDKLELIRLNSQLISLKKYTDFVELEKHYREELNGLLRALPK